MSNLHINTYEAALNQARLQTYNLLEIADREICDIASRAPGKLKERFEAVIFPKGKRIRSILLFLFAKSGTAPIDEIKTARCAASIELLHLASLIHDDVIDLSETRRGKKTAHTRWGNHMAVLVGDYILAKSLSLIVKNENNRVTAIISNTAGELVAGEVLEIDNQGNLFLTVDEYNQIIYGKTASLIEAAAEIGAIQAGHSQEKIELIKDIGRLFGMAFQIVDDLLDFEFGAEEVGKKSFTDIGNNVMTLPVILFLEKSSESERSEFKDLTLNNLTENSISRITSLFLEKNIFSECRSIALAYLTQAKANLSLLEDSPSRKLLIDICSAMSYRCN
jgi:octaprenyl-diphosphate synthase